MSKKVWTFTPHLGGKKISPETQNAVRKLITEYAEKNYHGKFTRLDIKYSKLKFRKLRRTRGIEVRWLGLAGAIPGYN